MNAPEAWWTDRRRADLSATQLRSPPAALIETIIRWAAARALAPSRLLRVFHPACAPDAREIWFIYR
jgi:hypothetical protein